MKNILKLLFAALLLPLLAVSCRDEINDDWTSSASFKLHETTLESNVLYSSMENNPFILTWDDAASAAGPYTVVVSATESFENKVQLGTSTTHTLVTTIGALNTAMLQAGLNPYAALSAYIRVEKGTEVSNAIHFTVTTYPTEVPVLTNPALGDAFVLNGQTPNDILTTVSWTDYASYGVDVHYVVEVSKAGADTWVPAGAVNNLSSMPWTHKMLNDAAFQLGLAPDVAAQIDVRVKATTESVGGTITKISDPVTITITPYMAFKNLYLVGEAVESNWNTNNNNQAMFRDPNDPNKFHITAHFYAGGFKLIEILGQWQPQYGQVGGVVAVNEGGGSDPDPFNVPAAGYYKFEIDILAKTYSLTPATAPTTTYSVLGIIGSATPNGWDTPDTKMTPSALNPNLWMLKGVTLTAGEIKFRVNDDWAINWGSNTPLCGIGTSGGPNIPVEEAGTYDVFFNSADGSYQLIKL